MPLTKPNQQLQRDLKAVVILLEETALELFSLAKERGDTEFIDVMRAVGRLHGHADRMSAYEDEVKAGVIVRTKTE